MRSLRDAPPSNLSSACPSPVAAPSCPPAPFSLLFPLRPTFPLLFSLSSFCVDCDGHDDDSDDKDADENGLELVSRRKMQVLHHLVRVLVCEGV